MGVFFSCGWQGSSSCDACGLLVVGPKSTGFAAAGLWLWCAGIVALKRRHLGSSLVRERTHVPCVGRWILCHWATRKAPE